MLGLFSICCCLSALSMTLRINQNHGFYRQGANHAQITRSTFLFRAVGGERVPEVSAQIGVSDSTGYRWLAGWLAEGVFQRGARAA